MGWEDRGMDMLASTWLDALGDEELWGLEQVSDSMDGLWSCHSDFCLQDTLK